MRSDLVVMFGVSVLSGVAVYFLTTRLQRGGFAHDRNRRTDDHLFSLRVNDNRRRRSKLAAHVRSLTGAV